MMSHYYGDWVRRIFITMAAIMVGTYPFVFSEVPFSYFVSIFGAIVLVVLAGLTNPLQKVVNLLNLAISLVALTFFEYYAVTTYNLQGIGSLFFWGNQTLAMLSLFGLYFSAKTARAMALKRIIGKDD